MAGTGMAVACLIYKMAGQTGNGKPVYVKSAMTKCFIVEMKTADKKAIVLSDYAVSADQPENATVDAKILLSKTDSFSPGDKILCRGKSMKITAVVPKYNIAANLDHFEVSLCL